MKMAWLKHNHNIIFELKKGSNPGFCCSLDMPSFSNGGSLVVFWVKH